MLQCPTCNMLMREECPNCGTKVILNREERQWPYLENAWNASGLSDATKTARLITARTETATAGVLRT